MLTDLDVINTLEIVARHDLVDIAKLIRCKEMVALPDLTSFLAVEIAMIMMSSCGCARLTGPT